MPSFLIESDRAVLQKHVLNAICCALGDGDDTGLLSQQLLIFRIAEELQELFGFRRRILGDDPTVQTTEVIGRETRAPSTTGNGKRPILSSG